MPGTGPTLLLLEAALLLTGAVLEAFAGADCFFAAGLLAGADLFAAAGLFDRSASAGCLFCHRFLYGGLLLCRGLGFRCFLFDSHVNYLRKQPGCPTASYSKEALIMPVIPVFAEIRTVQNQ